jgi:hypothetical protein
VESTDSPAKARRGRSSANKAAKQKMTNGRPCREAQHGARKRARKTPTKHVPSLGSVRSGAARVHTLASIVQTTFPASAAHRSVGRGGSAAEKLAALAHLALCACTPRASVPAVARKCNQAIFRALWPARSNCRCTHAPFLEAFSSAIFPRARAGVPDRRCKNRWNSQKHACVARERATGARARAENHS